MLTTPIRQVELELTTLCNAHCQLCYRNYKAYDEHYPVNKVRPLEDVLAQLETMPDLEWVLLVGSISEPTLYPHFFPLVEYIKSRGLKIEICTNGDTNNITWWKHLGTLLGPEDKVYFTVCGSTQQGHEFYRKGTRLLRILLNAAMFRNENKNDYAQCIRFSYNNEDFDSPEFKEMVSEFSNVYWTETFLYQMDPVYKESNQIQFLGPTGPKFQKYLEMDNFARKKFDSPIKGKANCMSWNKGNRQIDIDGKEYPCYLFLEASGGKPWDGDYEKILNMEYDVCKYCDRAVIELCDKLDLRYII